MVKVNFFIKLKYNFELKKLNKLKAELIYNKLFSSVKVIMKFYQKKESTSVLKTFIMWKDTSFFLSRLVKYKNDFEQILQKRLQKEISFLEGRLKEKEKEINEFKKNLNKHLELEGELSNKIRNYEEKEFNFLTSIKKIEEDNKIIQSELTFLERNNLDYYKNKKNLEMKIKEYEEKIVNLQEENKEKDYSITLFLREMGELLQAHEKNIDLMNIDIDMEENKSSIMTTTLSKPSIKISNFKDPCNPLLISSNSSLSNNIYSSNNLSNFNVQTSQNLSSSIRNFSSILNTVNSNSTSKPMFAVTNSTVNQINGQSNNQSNISNLNSNSKASIGYKTNFSLNNNYNRKK